MGFEAPENTYVLQFEAGDKFDGLEVKVRPPTTGEALSFMDLSWITDNSLTQAENKAKLTELYGVFTSRLVEWNVTRGGFPVPTTMDGLLTLDHNFVLRIVRSWLFETSGVTAPLDDDSNTGSDLVDESQIPMTAPSVALAS